MEKGVHLGSHLSVRAISDTVRNAAESVIGNQPTYTKAQTPLENKYNVATPDPGYISGWHSILEGPAAGPSISLDIRKPHHSFFDPKAATLP